ncbi:MAG TPA: excinuclease ABC subunit UvrC [bacterium]|nr:excinuclease ABC subunit UvrC [bacterium]
MDKEIEKSLRETVSDLPASPGVYIYKDLRGRVIYVGKAKSLKSRVSSYFNSSHADSEKTRLLVQAIREIDFILTENELEALLLESTLIKKHRPRYNIRLKDDSGYPFLKLTNEDFPRLQFVRRIQKDGATYFGPYSSAAGVRGTVRFLKRVFPLRYCDRMKKQPCIYYHLEKCPGPCSGDVSPGEYAENVRAITLFLEGRAHEVVRNIESAMKEAAAGQHFERAAVLRDRLQALQSVIGEKQTVIFPDRRDRDIIGIASGENLACAEIMFIRDGRLTGHDPVILDISKGEQPPDILTAFISLYYEQASSIPGEVLMSHEPHEPELITRMLREKAGRAVTLRVPKRGEKKKMLEHALRNARRRLEDEQRRTTMDRENRRRMTQAITARVESRKLIRRIICFDISTIQGTNTVGAAVAFLDAKPDKNNYRKFIIRSGGRDDFSSMREMAKRFFSRVISGDEQAPDLVIVDGGKGQVSAVQEGIHDSGINTPPVVIGYAKKTGISHVMGQETPIVFDAGEPASELVQRCIAEAHRFAISFHRKKRGESMLES